MKTLSVGIILFLCSCSNRDSCTERTPITFEKFALFEDDNFQEFLWPNDSIDDIIEKKSIRPIHIIDDRGYSRYAWKNNGEIIKMMGQGPFDDYTSTLQFYRLNQCNWNFQKDKVPNDSTLGIDHVWHYYSFKDSVVLNSFVTRKKYDFKMLSRLDSDSFAKGLAESYHKWYQDYLKIFE